MRIRKENRTVIKEKESGDSEIHFEPTVIIELSPREAKELQKILFALKGMMTNDFYAHRLYQEMNKIHPIQNES